MISSMLWHSIKVDGAQEVSDLSKSIHKKMMGQKSLKQLLKLIIIFCPVASVEASSLQTTEKIITTTFYCFLKIILTGSLTLENI